MNELVDLRCLQHRMFLILHDYQSFVDFIVGFPWISLLLLYCCCYSSFLWGYLINDRLVCLDFEKYLLILDLLSKHPNDSRWFVTESMQFIFTFTFSFRVSCLGVKIWRATQIFDISSMQLFLIGILLRWGFLIWELIFIYCGLFVLIFVVFVLFLLSLCFGQNDSN